MDSFILGNYGKLYLVGVKKVLRKNIFNLI